MVPRIKRILIGVSIGSAAFAGIILLLIHTVGDHDTLYRGKPFEYWADQVSNPKGQSSNDVSILAETVIVPQLINVMFSDTNDFKLRLILVDQLNGLPGVNIHFTPADGRRAQAAGGLGQLGLHAKAALPSLIKALKSNDNPVRPAAARALGQIGTDPEKVIPLLIASIDDSQDGVPESAVEALGDFGKLSQPAVPKILPLLKTPDKDLRHAANVAIAKIDPSAANSKN